MNIYKDNWELLREYIVLRVEKLNLIKNSGYADNSRIDLALNKFEEVLEIMHKMEKESNMAIEFFKESGAKQ
jgi:Zn-dependent oligopeptidase